MFYSVRSHQKFINIPELLFTILFAAFCKTDLLNIILQMITRYE